MNRRRLLRVAAALPLFAIVRRAMAEDTLTLLVGAAGGSPEDHAARAFAPFLDRHLPDTGIAVANLPGNAGLAACHALLDAPADGTTLLWAATPALPVACLAGDEGALLDRVAFLTAIRKEPVAFVSPALSSLATTRDLLRVADTRASALPLATPQAGSPAHLAALQFQAIGGAPLAIVAFPSAAAARQAVRAGTACAGAFELSDVIDDLRDGRLMGLGITASSRVDVFPDIAPMADAGLALSGSVLRGIATRFGIPGAAKQRLLDAMGGITADPEFRADADANGFQVAGIDAAAWTSTALAARDDLSQFWPSNARQTAEAATQPR